jgi:hypothetical protein
MVVRESYGRLGEDDDFDLRFWQSQPVEAIFDAAFEIVKDYLLLKEGHADQPRLQRTVESFGKI